MGFLDRILGRELPEPERRPASSSAPRRSDDEIAVERYEYLLRTAPPETIEQVHTEAFGRLTPEQRDLLFARLSENSNPSERPADAAPATLAKAATRTELQHPGTLTRTFGGAGQAPMGFGGMVGSSLLGTVAGYVIGSALVSAFLPMDAGGEATAADSGESDETGGDAAGDDGGGGFGDFGGGGDGGGFGDFGF